jgi:hypothetical protein
VYDRSGRCRPVNTKRDPLFQKDHIFEVKRDGIIHVISEGYFYKTDSYYTILSLEMKGVLVSPGSTPVLDAYVVPICLEKAGRAGIPVCEWIISQSYVQYPAIIYGINYFATSAEFAVVEDPGEGKKAIKHVTNNGKYPFCYQKLDTGASIGKTVAIFGKTCSDDPLLAGIAEKIYTLFGIPLVTMVVVNKGGSPHLSSLAPTRYSRLTHEEKALLHAYVTNQEFL